MEVTKKTYKNSYVRGVILNFPTIIFGVGLLISAFVGFRIWLALAGTFEMEYLNIIASFIHFL
jgi:hypothetical protein